MSEQLSTGPLPKHPRTLPTRRIFCQTAFFAGLIAATGCREEVQPPPAAPLAPATSSPDIEMLQSELQSLEADARTHDALLASDIRSLRDTLSQKIDKTDAVEMVRKELERKEIVSRLRNLEGRLENLDNRIRSIEEQFGILPRIPEAPWYTPAK